MPDRKKVSFREAEGKPRFPPILQWGEIDQRVRAALWNVFLPVLADITFSTNHGGWIYREPTGSILFREHTERQHLFANEFSLLVISKDAAIVHWSKFFKTADYLELFDFVTFFLRDKACPKRLIDGTARALDAPYCPYRIVADPPNDISSRYQ